MDLSKFVHKLLAMREQAKGADGASVGVKYRMVSADTPPTHGYYLLDA
jgi:hypothetical protein